MRLLILLLNLYTVYAEVCLGTQRTQDNFLRTMYAKYGGNTCASPTDCETKCTTGCDGYSQIPSGTVVLQVSTGTDFSCSLSSDGVVHCWGKNNYNQLGDGTTTTRATPVTPTLESAAVAVECGDFHACALLDTGKVQCWGRNHAGQLGIGSTTTKSTPQTVLNIEGVTQLSVGQNHNCVLFGTGEVKCWGDNYYGQLGIGSTSSQGYNLAGNSMAGLQFTDLDGSARRVECGGQMCCAIMMNNDLKCWGWNNVGQLGIDSTTAAGNVANTMGSNLQVTMSNVLKVAIGESTVCAITTGFTVHCWGRGKYLGYDDTSTRKTPGAPVSLGKDAVDIDVGYRASCALFKDGTAKCWGMNIFGKLGINVGSGDRGDGAGEMAALPFIDFSGASTGECWMIDMAMHHACAVVDGKVTCWGYNSYGVSGGSGSSSEFYEPEGTIDYGYGAVTYTYAYGSKVPMVAGVSKELTDICAPCVANEYVQQRYESGSYTVEAGQTSYTCNTLAECEPQCSGDANCVGYTEDKGLKAVAFGRGAGFHQSVLFSDGSVRCWATDGYGDRCGTDDDSTFYNVNDPSTWGLTKLSGPAIAVADVEYGGCALMQDGSLECWMDYAMYQFVFVNPGTSGKVGNSPDNPMEQHRALDTGSYRFKNISSSESGMCGILKGADEGKVACFGSFGYPPLIYSDPTYVARPGMSGDPLAIMDFGSPAIDLSCGHEHCCFLLSAYVQNTNKYGSTSCVDAADCETKCDADATCEGYTNIGGSVQVWGDSNNGGADPGLTSGVTKIFSTGWGFAAAFAALKADGSVNAWGNSAYGGADPGITSGVSTIVATGYAFAALKNDGSVAVWGASDKGGADPGLTSGVTEIFSARQAFAAVKDDGSVVAWGNSGNGGADPGITSGVTKIFSNWFAFAALKDDGSVQVWGNSAYGGTDPGITSGVTKIFSTKYAFAALKDDGSVVAWGGGSWGGADPGITSGVVDIAATEQAFAAVKTDGSVQVWGESTNGGNDPGITSGVTKIFSTNEAFAALKSDGSVTVWGPTASGGGANNVVITSGAVDIFSTVSAFAALKDDGSVTAWGGSSYGGTDPGITSGVTKIFSTWGAFAALKTDGSVQVWGDSNWGGTDPGITSGVSTIFSTGYAFAAIVNPDFVYGPLIAGTGDSFAPGGGDIKCFGDNSIGQLGIGSTTVVKFPDMVAVDIGTHVPAKIFCGRKTTHVITTTGDLIGWGYNHQHELGYNDADYAFGYIQGDAPGEMGANLIVTMTNVRDMGGRVCNVNALVTNDDIMYTTTNVAQTPSWGQRATNVNFVGTYGGCYGPKYFYVKNDGMFGGKDTSENPAYATLNMKNMGMTCITCAGGTYNRPGDTAAGTCDDDETCNANFYSDGTQCVACPSGSTSVGAAVIDGNSYCKRNAPCGVDEYVNEQSVCAICPFGQFSDATASEYTATPCLKPAATCGENEHSSIQYLNVDTRYFGNTCTNCETDCTNDATCLGYTPGNKIVSMSGYYQLGCSASSEGVKCWGKNTHGVLGIGSSDATLQVTSAEATNIPLQGVVKIRSPKFGGTIHAVWAIFEDGSVRSWGSDFKYRLGYEDSGNRNEPGPPIETHGGEVKDMCGGYGYSCMLLKDGRVFCWGGYSYSYPSGWETPSTVKNTASLPALDFGGTASAIACGELHACVVIDEKVKCWTNRKEFGLIGGNSLTAYKTVTPSLPYVLGLTKPVVDIASTQKTTCALYNDGTVKCWGKVDALPYDAYSAYGLTVGDAAGEMETAPEADITNVIKIEGGFEHFCAVISGGGLKCWGRNQGIGHVGYDKSTYQVYLPQDDLSPELGTVVDVNTGWMWSCAILDTGNAKCFGSNSGGQRGDSDTANRDASDATDLYASVYDDSYGAMTSSGKGYAKRSQCGACPVNTTRPAGDSLSGATWCISETTCGKDEFMNTNYECQACAEGVFNNAGDNSPGICNDQAVCTDNQHVSNGMCVSCPANTTNPAGDDTNNGNSYCTLDIPCAQNEYVNNQHQCVSCPPGAYNDVGDTTIGSCDDTEKCNDGYHVKTTFTSDNTKKYGSTPCDNTTDCESKCAANATCAGYTSSHKKTIAIGAFGICTLKTDGTINCWGKNAYGDLGVGDTDPKTLNDHPQGVQMNSVTSASWMALGESAHTCVIDSGTVKCTGRNNYGQLGDGTTVDRTTVISNGITTAVQVESGNGFSCALLADGEVKCWGWGGNGMIGDGSSTDRHSPVSTGITDAVQISCGGFHVCALLSDKTVKCWGDNGKGQLGDGTNTQRNTPVSVSNLNNVKQVSCGGRTTCAVLEDGTATCWGYNGNGRLGDNTTVNTNVPGTAIALGDTATKIVTAEGKTCALLTGGIKCWGSGYNGYGDQIDRLLPDALYINVGGTVVDVDIYQSFVVALLDDDSIKVWGTGYGAYYHSAGLGSWLVDPTLVTATAMQPFERQYGPQIAGTATSFVKAKGCQFCPAGYNNEAMDDPLLDDTTCDFIPCAQDQKVVSGSCSACVLGSTRPAGDADPLVDTYCTCGVNQQVINNLCTECPTGGTRPAGDDEAGADTECLIAPCAQDYHVVSGACVACPTGLTNDAGDTNELGDTFCDADFVCMENEYVSNHQCVACPARQTHPYGGDPGGADTTCSWMTCAKDEYSDGTQCQPCSYGTYNDVDDTLEVATTCDDTEVCDTTQYSALKFNLQTGQQISNGAGYSNGETDFAKAKRMCVKDPSCNGLTEDSGTYYLSDGTLSANGAYNAYELDRSDYECAVCVGGQSPYTTPTAPNGTTSCTFSNCLINQYADDFVCYNCPEGQVKSPAGNPGQDFSCTIVPCKQNEYVKETPGSVDGTTVTTIAGTGAQSPLLVDGAALETKFHYLQAMIHVNGIVHVVDYETNDIRIRKVENGQVTTVHRITGFGASGNGMTHDGTNFYVTLQQEHCVVRVAPDGTVTTVAGICGTSGSVDGDISTATLDRPTGIQYLDEKLYICTIDSYVRVVDLTSNQVTRIGSYWCSRGVTTDGTNLYFSRGNQMRRYKVSDGTNQFFNGVNAWDLSYYNGYVYIATHTHIKRMDVATEVITDIVGTGVEGTTDGDFSVATVKADRISASNGEVTFSFLSDVVIRKFEVAGLTASKECTACPEGGTNEPGDTEPAMCDFPACGKNQYSSGGLCVACATGFNDPGDSRGSDTTCDDLELCDANEHGVNGACVACPGAGTNDPNRVNETGTCTFPDCQTDQYSVGDGICLACPIGRTMPTPVNPSVASECFCAANQYVPPLAYVASSNKYEGSSCSDTSDCESKCAADSACAGYTNNGGSGVAWGHSDNGGTAPAGLTDVIKISSNDYAFAAIKSDGSVTVWGQYDSAVDPGITSGVVDIVSADFAFAALKSDGSVQAWGDSNQGGTDPGITSGVTKIFSSTNTFAALKSDGSVQCWGITTSGCPTANVVTIVSTEQAFAALKSDGSVKTWGGSTWGGSDPNLNSGVVAIVSTAKGAFAALKDDGSVKAWGSSSNGGADPGITSDVTKIFSTEYAFAALKSDGSVQVWGDTDNGGADPGIGAGSGVTKIFSTQKAFAALKSDGSVQVWGNSNNGGTDPGIGAGSGITDIFSNFLAFAALKSDGSVVAWGNSGYGGADPGIGAGSGVVEIFSSLGAFAALKDDGTVQAWGAVLNGGNAPVGLSGVSTIFSNQYAFVAITNPSLAYGPLVAGTGDSYSKTTGAACQSCPAGFTNEAGDDPNNATLCDFTPCEANQYVVGTDHTQVCTACTEGTYSAGGLVTECGSTEYCTGTQKVSDVYVADTNMYGPLPCDNATDCETKCTANATCEGYIVGSQGQSLGRGGEFVCAVLSGGTKCWGRNDWNIFNNGAGHVGDAANEMGANLPYLLSDVKKISGGGTSSVLCALLTSGVLECWGQSSYKTHGQSGTGAISFANRATAASDVSDWAMGTNVACAVMNSGAVKCWGANSFGQLGDGTISSNSLPTDVLNINNAMGVAVGEESSCALLTDGTVQCWGRQDKIGRATTADDPTPGDVGVTGAIKIDANRIYTCVVLNTGKITCWGYSYHDLFGDGGTNVGYGAGKHTVSNIGDTLPSAVKISVGNDHMCAVLDNGHLYCWGKNAYGQVGDGTSTARNTPVKIMEGVSSVICAHRVTCARLDDDSVKCWGRNKYGEVGQGDTIENRLSPLSVDLADTFPSTSTTYGPLIAGTGTSFALGKGCVDCPAKYENPVGPTTSNSTNGVCTPTKCQSNQYSDGSVCQPCPSFTGSDLSDYDPTLGATTCQAVACGTNQYVLSHECQLCPPTSYRAAGDEIFGTDTHCFCKDNHKVINKQCVTCEEGSSNPNLCYSGLEDHYCVCHENYHVVNNLCTVCPHGATRPAGDYAGNANTNCICGQDQHVVGNQCVTCPLGSSRPAGDDSSGPDTECSCSANEHVSGGQCETCPAGSTRLSGDLVSNGNTYCICEENYRVQDNQCVACENGSLRPAGDSGNNTYCACLEGQHVQSHVCTTCAAGYTSVAGEDATGADTNCTCADNFYSNGNGCVACPGTSIIVGGSDPTVPSECVCPINFEPETDSCAPCDATEESLGGTDTCKCKENHYYDGSACVACAPGAIRPAGDDKNSTTECTAQACAENHKVVSNQCQPCITGMVSPGDLATGTDTICTYQGTTHAVSVVGNYFYGIGGSNNPELTMRVGETHTFIRNSAGDPFRIVTEAECEGLQCDKAQYTTLPKGSLVDAVQDQSVTVFEPTTAGIYYYLSTETGYRKGRIVVDWPLCVITYPVTNITASCELSSEIVLSGDLTIQFVTNGLRAVQGETAQIKAADSARHFQVTSGRKLTMESLDLNGGRSLEGGSILVDNGNIDANNVKFSDNVATSSGGAIKVKNTASIVSISNILFENNQGSEGGALDIQDTLVQQAEIHSSDFMNNRAASGNGGAIKTNAPLNISLSNFEGNLANSGEGGGITATKDITISGSSFKANKAMKGGALKSVGNKITMSNMVIEANEAVEDGGAFSVENAEVDIRTSTIKANKAKRGGAMKIVATGCTTDCKTIKIQQSTLEANEATLEGGAVDLGGDVGAEPQFWVQDSNMRDNKAAGVSNDFKKRQNAKIKAIDSDVEAIDGGAVDAACEVSQCDGRDHSTCEVTATGTTCACDGVTRFLDGTRCKVYKTCPELGLEVTIHNGTKTHDKLCGTPDIQNIVYKLDDKGKALAEMIEQKLVAEGVAADQAYALAVEVFGEINKCS